MFCPLQRLLCNVGRVHLQCWLLVALSVAASSAWPVASTPHVLDCKQANALGEAFSTR